MFYAFLWSASAGRGHHESCLESVQACSFWCCLLYLPVVGLAIAVSPCVYCLASPTSGTAPAASVHPQLRLRFHFYALPYRLCTLCEIEQRLLTAIPHLRFADVLISQNVPLIQLRARRINRVVTLLRSSCFEFFEDCIR